MLMPVMRKATSKGSRRFIPYYHARSEVGVDFNYDVTFERIYLRSPRVILHRDLSVLVNRRRLLLSCGKQTSERAVPWSSQTSLCPLIPL